MIRRASDRLIGTDFERGVARAATDPRHDVLFFWNRGLGDVTLALTPLFARIRQQVPGARITVVTRAELEEPFRLTDADDVRVVASLPREAGITLDDLRSACGLDPARFATIFLDPDPTRWLHGVRGQIPPSLRWKAEWDALGDRVVAEAPGRTLVGAHVSSETAGYYSYVKDWPIGHWRELIGRFAAVDGVRWVLFGHRPEPRFDLPQVTDLRGRTGFLEMMAIVKSRCRVLIGPDSGILNTVYYLDVPFPIDLISLWSDPRHGILQQGCASPNRELRHVPIVGRDEDVRNIGVDEVERAVRQALRR